MNKWADIRGLRIMSLSIYSNVEVVFPLRCYFYWRSAEDVLQPEEGRHGPCSHQS